MRFSPVLSPLSSLTVGLLLPFLYMGSALASDYVPIDPDCDQTGPDGTPDGIVDEYAALYPDGYTQTEEDQQYINMLNFFTVSLGPSALHSPTPLVGKRLNASVEFSYMPSLTCFERSAFYGTKTEDTNRTPVVPRLRVSVALPYDLYVGLSGVPPVTLFGVNSGMLGLELGWGKVLHERVEVGARATALFSRIAGEMAGPAVAGFTLYEDVFHSRMLGIEASAGYRIPVGKATVVPYLHAGLTDVFAYMYVGENHQNGEYDEWDAQSADAPKDRDDVEGPDFSTLYTGPTLDVGVQVRAGKLDGAVEVYVVPTALDSGNSRNLISPRLRLGYFF